MRIDSRVRHAALAGLLLMLVVVPTMGCGSSEPPPPEPPFQGDIVVENATQLSGDPLALLSFIVAPFGLPFTGELLTGPLDPGNQVLVGTFTEDYYDGEGILDPDILIRWHDEFVGLGEVTVYVAE